MTLALNCIKLKLHSIDTNIRENNKIIKDITHFIYFVTNIITDFTYMGYVPTLHESGIKWYTF